MIKAETPTHSMLSNHACTLVGGGGGGVGGRGEYNYYADSRIFIPRLPPSNLYIGHVWVGYLQEWPTYQQWNSRHTNEVNVHELGITYKMEECKQWVKCSLTWSTITGLAHTTHTSPLTPPIFSEVVIYQYLSQHWKKTEQQHGEAQLISKVKGRKLV